MIFDHLDESWAKELESGLGAYMDALADYAYGEAEDEDFETISGELFCGCPTCEIREILAFVVPQAVKGLLDGKVIVNLDEVVPTHRSED